MLIRNLDAKNGHVNGARYIVLALTNKIIHARLATGPHKGEKYIVSNNQQNTLKCIYLFRQGNPNTKNKIPSKGQKTACGNGTCPISYTPLFWDYSK